MDLLHIYHREIPAFLQEAARTPAMERLQGVGMNCGCEYTSFPQFACWQPYSRFDHSMGAALITWHFTEDPHQAMAALLHDIATPVFSHVVDFLKGDYLTQESTEDGTQSRILQSSELMAVCKKYAIDPERITDYHIYPIADNDAPRLSADRLEYTLGNLVNFGFATREQVKSYYDDLQVQAQELVFATVETACAFARDALRCGKVYVSDADRYAMQILSEILQKGLQSGVLREADFYRQERDVIEKLMTSSLAPDWLAFRAMCRVEKAEAPGETGRKIFAKKRFIDPATANGSRASQLDAAFYQQLSAFQQYSFDYWLREVK